MGKWHKIDLTFLKPYFGVKIHPYKLDDDSSFETIPKRSRMFFNLGLTIGTIEGEFSRTDLFNTNNLQIGAGYNINRSLHFSAGFLVHRTENINPLIDRQPIRCAPYVSIGIHPNLNTIISSFTGLISGR